MGVDIPAVVLLHFLLGDFEAAWNSVAANSGSQNRGNFMFAMQSMILLEVTCRVCHADPNSDALAAVSAKLARRDPRYFTALPAACMKQPRDFKLPHQGSDPSKELLSVLFDLVRNGHGHQYQQIRARLSDGTDFRISITGAEHGASLDRTLAHGRPNEHLKLFGSSGRDLWIKFMPDVFFLDLRSSIEESQLLERGLVLKYLERQYPFSGRELEESFLTAGHEQDAG